MFLNDIFLSPKKKKGKSHLRNLMNVALADGVLDDSEYTFLKNIASKFEISDNEVDKLKIEIQRKSNFELDKGINRFDQIFDLINMMMIDNHIDNREMNMCKVFAKKIGFDSRIVDELVDSVIQNITIGNNLEETRKRVDFLIRE